jgi:ribosomal protein L37AE/L43A
MDHKIIYVSAKIARCPKCKQLTEQDLFDYNYSIYKCSKCNNIHSYERNS